jgi:endonuclease G, mitochondrial
MAATASPPFPRIHPTERRGYDPDFLSITLPLPTLTYETDMVSPPLAYKQFTFVLRRRRRLPLFTAVNIDGRQSQHARHNRSAWILAPRVPVDTANPEFNAGRNLWLALDDYVLHHPVTADRKVNVISGPVLGDGFPGCPEVVLPLQYWKLVAMVRRTGTLCVTGYLLRQKGGSSSYRTYQIPVRMIGELSGLDLSTYIAADPLDRLGTADTPRELSHLEHIAL